MKYINNHLNSSYLDKKFSGPCVCIGYGKSAIQMRAVPKWKKHFSIACNYAQSSFPSPIYTYQDRDFVNRSMGFISRYKFFGLPILPTARYVLHNKSLMQTLQGFFVNRIKHGNRPTWLDSKNSTHLFSSCPISGAVAAGMAYCMGFSPIIIVGYDAEPGSYRYYKRHPIHGSNNSKGMAMWGRSQHNFLKNWGKELGIINCSYSSAMEKHELSDVITDLDDENYGSSCDILEDIYFKNAKEFGSTAVENFIKKPRYSR
jgi:hypothetical protein